MLFCHHICQIRVGLLPDYLRRDEEKNVWNAEENRGTVFRSGVDEECVQSSRFAGKNSWAHTICRAPELTIIESWQILLHIGCRRENLAQAAFRLYFSPDSKGCR